MHFTSKVFATASFLMLGLTSAAAAGDSSDPIWSGFYVGAVGGSATGHSIGTLSHADPATPGVTAADIFASTSRTFDIDGPTGGIVLGYNYQNGFLVFGVEADMAWVGAKGSASATSIDTLTTWRLDTTLYSLGTLRGRMGVATGPVLWYGTAGLAWGLVKTENKVSCVGCLQDPWSQGVSKESHVGYVAGAGAEWLINTFVVLRAEYLLADLGSAKHTFKGTSASGTVETSPGSGVFVYDWDGINQNMQFQMWRLGVSVKFN